MGTADGTVLGTTKIVDNGPDEDKWCLLIAGDGFTSSEQTAFATAVDDFASFLETHLTGPLNWEKVNVIRLDVESDESGADNDGGSGVTVDTYFDATFGSGGIDRALTVDGSIAIKAANTQFPEWDALLVLVNSTSYGGATLGGVAAASLDPTFVNDTALHELGHAAFGLADEYAYLQGCDSGETSQDVWPNVNGEPIEPNVTNDIFTLKWATFVDPATSIPTTSNADCTKCDPQISTLPLDTVGAFEGGNHYHCNIWRPQAVCRMNLVELPFCAVCQSHIGTVLTLASLLDLTPCFVATTVYGEPEHPDVTALREWRDRHLAPGARGRSAMRVLTSVYRSVGPRLAALTQRRPQLKRRLRERVFAPWARMVR
jgi:IgA Peptidase M64